MSSTPRPRGLLVDADAQHLHAIPVSVYAALASAIARVLHAATSP